MKENKTKVFLTGATGVMGMAGLKELSSYPEKYDITVLARPSKVNRRKLKPYEKKGVRVLWGDLLDKDVLSRGIQDCDIILHVGGMVSPMADLYPEKTMKVNVGSMQHITDIIKGIESGDPSRIIKLVYIGSVAQYGSKMPPHHWGNASHELCPSKFDKYGESKVRAEELMKTSGIRKWVSLRQTGILHPGLLKNAGNPVAFHTPIHGVLEWISVEDSGRLLERVCRSDVPEEFWNKCYNVGGGEKFRLINIEFERGILKTMGCPPPEKVFEPNWFATDNFHGMWFEDSDLLDDILHFREEDTFEACLMRIKKSLPFYYKLAPVVPAFFIKPFMKKVASKKELGPLRWIKDNDAEKIEAAWGSLENYKRIQGWEDMHTPELSRVTPDITREDTLDAALVDTFSSVDKVSEN